MKSDEEYEAMVSRLVHINTSIIMWSIMLGFMLGFGILMGWGL